LDPPFNLGKHYSDDHPGLDDRPDTEYEEWLKQVVLAAAGVLRPGGALYLYHLPVWAMRVGPMLEKHLTFRQWIAVSMKNGFVRGQRLYPAHYALMMFSKGELGRFSRPRIAPKLCRHCGGLVKDYGGYRSIIDEKGINLSDVWEDLSPVRHGKTKNRAANELPIRLFQRIFEMSGGTGLTYVDPFAGGGTGVVTAAKSGMLFRANDLVQSNCDLIVGRLDELQGKS
jgi:site-specific DNA-methyltransferase (adenine-specific)